MLRPGDEVDRYVVEGEIATGGMAEVYRVRHRQLDSVHALKVLVLRTKDIRRRLLQEGRVQAALNHPNAIMVTDVVEVEGHPGLVMEFVDGPTLGAWVFEEEPTFSEIERVFRQIVSAIGEAHRVGLIHRDLKPSNVLMARAGVERIPKVIDFGLAKVMVEEEDHTRTGVPMGTPSYMAPEQIADAKNVDPRADLFSLGALLYFMVCRRKAFHGSNAVETYNAVLAGDYEAPERVRDDIPDPLIRAIHACLKVRPDDRVSSAAALVAILDGERPPPPQGPPKPWVPLGLGLAGVAVLVGAWSLAEPPTTAIDTTTKPTPIEATGPADGESPRRVERTGDDVTSPPPQAGAADACVGEPGQILGYALVPNRAKRVARWVFDAPARLLKTPSGAPSGCTLPPGTGVQVVAKPEKTGGDHWLAVYAEAIQRP